MHAAPAAGELALTAYRFLLASLPHSILCHLDRDLRVTAITGSALAELFAEPHAFLGKSLRVLLPPVLWTAVEARLHAALAGEAGSEELVRAGAERWHIAVTPLLPEDRQGAAAPGDAVALLAVRLPEPAPRSSSPAHDRSLFADFRSPMLLLDPETRRIVDANPAAVAYYGWSHAEITAMTGDDLLVTILPDPLDVIRASAGDRGDRNDHFYVRQRLAGGGTSDAEAFGGEIYRDGRRLSYVVVHDITARRRTEKALVQSEAALRRSQAVAHVGHWTWDTRTNIVTWSDEMKRIFGLDPETFAGDLEAVITHAIHPEDRERVRALNSRVMDTQQPAATEYRVIWPDSTVRHVEATPGDQVVDTEGHILQLSGVVQDVTERTLREQEREQLLRRLADQAEQLAQIMRSVPDGVLLLDASSQLVLANPRAETMLTRLATYGTQHQLLELGHLDIRNLLTSPPAGQWHTLRVDRAIYEIMAWPVEAGPVPAGWVLILRDVTKERAIHEQLQRQERLAVVGQLAAGIAHDFNNIMSVIAIYAELVSESPGLADQDHARATVIISQAQRASTLIRQILDFSRQSVLERELVNLLPLIKELEKLLHQTLPENIEVGLVFERGEYTVLADPTRIQQLVMNLALNARDAMPQGGQLRLALSSLTVDSSRTAPVPNMALGEWVKLTVQDTGSGMAPEVLAHVFEPFFTTKAPGLGTGLGLAQVHGIVAQHQGHVDVTSEPGVGTTFFVYLPAHVLAAAQPAEPHRALPRGQGECILLVEDDPALRASLVELLEMLNYRVVEASHGMEALDLLLDRAAGIAHGAAGVELILSDVVMPHMGGVALLKALRRQGISTPAILLSGHPLHESLDDLRSVGVYALLAKPASGQQLAAAIAAALGRTPDA